MLYLVTYDLKKPIQDYPALYHELKTNVAWWHYLESTWLLKTNESINILTDKLRRAIDSDDRILIFDVTNMANNGWLPQEAWDWIREHISS